MKPTTLLLLLLSAISCSPDGSKKTSTIKSLPRYIAKNHILIDQTPYTVESEKFKLDSGKTFFSRMGFYLVYYIGKDRDTIRLPRDPVSWRADSASEAGYDEFKPEEKQPSSSNDGNISIFVDTTRLLIYNPTTAYFYNLDPVTKRYQAFPVYITNHRSSSLPLGSFNTIRMVREAQDSLSHWNDIEQRISYDCGVGARTIVLKPKNVLVTKLIRYSGKIKAKCRLRLGEGNNAVYSNVFEDYISR